VDHGTWRRLCLLRFRYTFRKPGEELVAETDRRGDPGLRDRIRIGADGQHDAVVTWAVEGAVKYHQDPNLVMAPSPRVVDDTRAWQVEADRILGYWDEKLVPDRDGMVVTTELRDDFNAWLRANGHNEWTKELFGPRFLNHNETVKHGVDQVMTRSVGKLSRRPGVEYAGSLPKQVRVCRGIRFRTGSD
jgi:putative DNA primase/helicase